jgi:Phosphotransferase enzyme family
MRAAAAAALVERALGVTVAAVEPLAASVGNHNFRVRPAHGGPDLILKSAPGDLLAAEAWACTRLRAAGLPVPEVVVVSDGGPATAPRDPTLVAPASPDAVADARGRPAAGRPVPEVVARSDGGPVVDGRHPAHRDTGRDARAVPYLLMRMLPGAPTEHRDGWRQAGRQMRVVHGVTLPGFGRLVVDRRGARGGLGTWRDRISGILDHLPDLVATGIVTARVADRAAAVVRASGVAGRQAGVLLHQDLKPQHVLSVDGRLTGIIDWGDAGVGDPVWDLARVSMAGPDALDGFLDGYGRAGYGTDGGGLDGGGLDGGGLDGGGLDGSAIHVQVPGSRERGLDGCERGLDGCERALGGAGRERAADLAEGLRAYRILWNVEALHAEHRYGGDWFDVYRDRLSQDTVDGSPPGAGRQLRSASVHR